MVNILLREHAVLAISLNAKSGKLEAWLEDKKTSNGTYFGRSPMEMERITGTVPFPIGHYMRFGHSKKF